MSKKKKQSRKQVKRRAKESRNGSGSGSVDASPNALVDASTPSLTRSEPGEEPKGRPTSEPPGEGPDAPEEVRKTEFLDALNRTLGCGLGACRKTGTPRETFERWMREDEEFARDVQSISEDAVDYVESRMLEEIKSGNAKLIQFYLERKARSRGYGRTAERVENASIVVLSQDELDY